MGRRTAGAPPSPGQWKAARSAAAATMVHRPRDPHSFLLRTPLPPPARPARGHPSRCLRVLARHAEHNFHRSGLHVGANHKRGSTPPRRQSSTAAASSRGRTANTHTPEETCAEFSTAVPCAAEGRQRDCVPLMCPSTASDGGLHGSVGQARRYSSQSRDTEGTAGRASIGGEGHDGSNGRHRSQPELDGHRVFRDTHGDADYHADGGTRRERPHDSQTKKT